LGGGSRVLGDFAFGIFFNIDCSIYYYRSDSPSPHGTVPFCVLTSRFEQKFLFSDFLTNMETLNMNTGENILLNLTMETEQDSGGDTQIIV
jgi:hypothetical protein